METAPYRADLAEGPEDLRAVWCETDDDVRLRLGISETGNRGTVLIFPGRTECIEKYGRISARLAQEGFATLCIDWRGQGLSDRLSDNPILGHVRKFKDYQLDVQVALDAARDHGLPEPFHLLAHSMGGAIGLRALLEGMPVHSVAFSAPMWGIPTSTQKKWIGRHFGWLFVWLGLGEVIAPGTDKTPYLLNAEFPGNLLTTDPDEFAYMVRQVVEIRELGIAGPSLNWVREAICESHWFESQSLPDLPVTIGYGSNERVVPTEEICTIGERWSGANLIKVQDAEHEILMESPDKRATLFEPILQMFRETT